MKIEIEKVSNGYIIQSDVNKEVHESLDNVLDHLLSVFEGRSRYFTGDSYGKVIIEREPNE